MSKKDLKNEIKTLTQREHILLRPAMYIGAVDLNTQQEYILEDGKIQEKEIQIVPGLIKIINEIIDNSVDVAIKTGFKHGDKIDVKIEKDYVQVQDNGTGIPVKKTEDGMYMPSVAWGVGMSGSNFDDDENRTQIGMNGVGSFATNCFSKKFIGKTNDGIKDFTVTFTDNASEHKESVKDAAKTSKTGTDVKFYPDLERFGLKEIDKTHISVIEQRLINLSMSFPEIRFRLNGKQVNSGTFRKFAEMFGEDPVILESDNYRYAILYNPEDDFRHFSYVNGLKIPNGGTHIEAVVEPVVANIRERLQRRYKGIRPADVRNKLLVLAFLKDLPNPKFNSQMKEQITNSRPEINKYLDGIDLDKLSNAVYRNKSIIDGITEIYRIKEEFRKRQEMKDLKKVRKIKSDKYLPAIKKKKYLFLCEGDSALGGALPTLGREECGYYVLRGKPLNVITATHQRFMANKELSELYQIIQNEEYQYVISLVDQDADANSIHALLAGFIWKMLPDWKDRFGRLETPVKVITKDDEPVRWAYSVSEPLEAKRGEVFIYMKGLGGWGEDLGVVIEKDGLENMIKLYNFDDDKILLDWLDKDSAPRKEYIMANDFSIDSV